MNTSLIIACIIAVLFCRFLVSGIQWFLNTIIRRIVILVKLKDRTVIKELYYRRRFTRNAVRDVLEPFCLSCDQIVYTTSVVCFVTLEGVPLVLC